MVEDLLAAATADRDGLVMSMSGVDPAEEVDEVLAPLAVVGVEARVTMENALITADRTRLRQVIRNLVSNADRHGGPDITISGRVVGDRYVIEVGDNGPGVPAELEERMFTRFVHEGDTPLVKGSVGLGLSVARVLTERMGGTITYRRENGETRFSVTLPQASQRQGRPAPAASAMG
jgi:signal transduction histidine kinase